MDKVNCQVDTAHRYKRYEELLHDQLQTNASKIDNIESYAHSARNDSQTKNISHVKKSQIEFSEKLSHLYNCNPMFVTDQTHFSDINSTVSTNVDINTCTAARNVNCFQSTSVPCVWSTEAKIEAYRSHGCHLGLGNDKLDRHEEKKLDNRITTYNDGASVKFQTCNFATSRQSKNHLDNDYIFANQNQLSIAFSQPLMKNDSKFLSGSLYNEIRTSNANSSYVDCRNITCGHDKEPHCSTSQVSLSSNRNSRISYISQDKFCSPSSASFSDLSDRKNGFLFQQQSSSTDSNTLKSYWCSESIERALDTCTSSQNDGTNLRVVSTLSSRSHQRRFSLPTHVSQLPAGVEKGFGIATNRIQSHSYVSETSFHHELAPTSFRSSPHVNTSNYPLPMVCSHRSEQVTCSHALWHSIVSCLLS